MLGDVISGIKVWCDSVNDTLSLLEAGNGQQASEDPTTPSTPALTPVMAQQEEGKCLQ